ncbi:MAG: dTDP-glucose 4,6-dehydratase [Candidatus Marinimicrobia bacterium]|nr:dTDP-glucose 4,6-dehydratase [Candidatus Neomarinimicrobiota bacterium]
MGNILVTGGCGFIGSNFIKYYLDKYKNLNIINLDKLTYAGNIMNLEGVSNSDYTFVNGDICDANLVESLFKKYKFHTLVNFAAESHVDRSIDGPAAFINTNVLGTLNLLEQARKFYNSNRISKNFRFIHISTDEVYGSLGRDGKFSEISRFNPNSPYSASKASSDHLVKAWYRTFGLPTLITNCSNNYGPFQFPEKLIPLTIINCLENKKLPIYGTGQNVRDWLYVKDHCAAIEKVIKKGSVGETYNIGGLNEIKNIDIVKRICRILDKTIPNSNGSSYQELVTYVEDRPGHDHRYAVDINKIKNNLGWSPEESFDTGIKKTIEWYLENKSWWRGLKKKYNQQRLGLVSK